VPKPGSRIPAGFHIQRIPRIPGRFLDWRWLPAYAVVVALVAWGRPQPALLAVGLACVAAGLALRVWSAGHLVKTERLVRSGPYAYVRHPLYAGTLLVGGGFVLAAAGPLAPPVLAAWLAVFFAYYLPYKERIESARLERRHGDAYRRYRDAVPALVPRGRRWPPPTLRDVAGAAPRWSARRFRESSERHTLAAAGAALLVLGLRAGLG